MASTYPTAIDTFADVSASQIITSTRMNDLCSAVTAVQTDTRTRLNAIDTNGINNGEFLPADIGLLACNFDPAVGVATSTPLNSNGVLYLAKIRLDRSKLVTNIVVGVTTAGATLTAGQNKAAIYDSTGTLVTNSTTGDQSTAWTATGPLEMACTSPVTLAAGYYWVGLWANGTTRPAFHRGVSATIANGITTGATARFATAGTGITTAAPGTTGTRTTFSTAYWVGFS